MIKTIIIDDEDSCQNVLRELLNYSNKQVQILATAKTIDEGIKIINEHRPELVFLDVELKDKLSFEILEKVRVFIKTCRWKRIKNCYRKI